MEKSTLTKKYSKWATIFGILSTIAMLGPLIGYTIAGFLAGTITVASKVVLGLSLVVAICLTAYGFLTKISFRCVSFIMLIGLVLCINHLLPMMLVVCGCNVLDELVFTPLHKKYKNLATINGQIDARL